MFSVIDLRIDLKSIVFLLGWFLIIKDNAMHVCVNRVSDTAILHEVHTDCTAIALEGGGWVNTEVREVRNRIHPYVVWREDGFI